MKNIFIPKANAKIRPHDIRIRHHNTATNGNKNYRETKIWNKRTWFGPSCKCDVLQM